MKKAIKIIDDNSTAIFLALRKVNGEAEAHTFVFPAKIIELVDVAEKALAKAMLLKKFQTGAKLIAVSGKPVANSYKYSRQATQVVLERKKTGWFLVEIESASVWCNGGSHRLVLTEQQVVEAVAKFKSTLHTSIKS